MFNSKENQKVLTLDTGYGKKVLDSIGESAVRGLVGTGVVVEALALANAPLAGTAVGLGLDALVVGGAMHTIAATNANVPLHATAHTVMKAGAIGVGAGLGVITVGFGLASVLPYIPMLGEGDKANAKILPLSARRLAKYEGKEKTIESVSNAMMKKDLSYNI
jgi:hypothetical protein